MMRKLFVAGIMALLVPAMLRAQGLEQSVPGDAIVYIGWAGAESMGEGYDQSHLKAVLEASQIKQFYTDFLPKLFQKIGREEREMAPVTELVSALAEPMWKYPTAIYFGGMDTSDPREPTPRLAVMMHARGDAAGLVRKVNAAVARLPDLPVKVVAAEKDGVLVATIGELPEGAASLATNETYAAAMAKVGEGGVVSMYIDVEAAVAMIDALVERYNRNNIEEWNGAKTGLNLGGMRRIAYRGSFSGPDWSDVVFIDAPSPRTGVAALFDLQALPADALAVVPRDATLAMAGRYDLSRVMQEIRAGVQRVDASAAAEMEEGLARIADATDVDIEKDLIEPMGDQWAVYAAPSVGGDGLMGFALVNKLDDPARVDQSLWQLAQVANNAMAEQMEGEVTLAFKQTEIDGLRLNYFAIPLVSPSWAIRDGNLYVGLYPQVVVGAANHVATSGPSLAENAAFQDMLKRLGAPEGASVQFIDMESRVPGGYASWLAIMRLYLGMADMWGVQSPVMFMPPLHVVMQHVSPAGVAYWSDAQGAYMRSVQPFPGSTQLATTDMGSFVVGQQAMMFSILLPSLNRARETANRVKCASNMRQIGQAILLYSNENRGQYPKDLGTLLITQDIGIDVFICPSGNYEIPAHIRQAPVEQQAAWVNENAAFVYVGTGLTMNTARPDEVVLYEREGNHAMDGMNFLYGDGHVEFQNWAGAQQEIQQARPPAGEPAGL